MGPETLLLIPCCADKVTGGRYLNKYYDELSKSVGQGCYDEMLSTRHEVLVNLLNNSMLRVGKGQKNNGLRQGVDFGGTDDSGKYLPAINRYCGTLYSVPGFKCALKKTIESADGPNILILSALYGPLHPLTEIQDYNLQMSDIPAHFWKVSFKKFLEDYIIKNKIKKIYLYLGASTKYLQIAKPAVTEFLNRGLINLGIQYHVINGSTYHTPHKHGLQMVSDLEHTSRPDGIEEIILKAK